MRRSRCPSTLAELETDLLCPSGSPASVAAGSLGLLSQCADADDVRGGGGCALRHHPTARARPLLGPAAGNGRRRRLLLHAHHHLRRRRQRCAERYSGRGLRRPRGAQRHTADGRDAGGCRWSVPPPPLPPVLHHGHLRHRRRQQRHPRRLCHHHAVRPRRPLLSRRH